MFRISSLSPRDGVDLDSNSVLLRSDKSEESFSTKDIFDTLLVFVSEFVNSIFFVRFFSDYLDLLDDDFFNRTFTEKRFQNFRRKGTLIDDGRRSLSLLANFVWQWRAEGFNLFRDFVFASLARTIVATSRTRPIVVGDQVFVSLTSHL